MAFESLSNENRKFQPPASLIKRSHLPDFETYKKMYQHSIQDPEGFWSEMAQSFVWHKTWSKVCSYDWKNKIDIKWFEGAKTNICENALDRHLPKNKDRVAFTWIGNELSEEKKITYGELHAQVCRVANGLKKIGVKKGDRVAIYMPMVLELPMVLLACARIGAIHSVIFGGFSAESLKNRILDSGAKILVTSDGAFRGSKKIPLKATCDEAMELCKKENHQIQNCIVYRRTDENVSMVDGRDLWWDDFIKNQSDQCAIESMDAEDPLFILYTSGSTGKPKGVLHTTAGYMVYVTQTFKYVFDYHPEDLYWCTADIGWVTGHSYVVYGPLCAGASSIIFEGIPNHPQPDRFWDIIERYKVTTFYTAPTAIRALMREGDSWPGKHDLSSLKILGTVGEPINPEAWIWYQQKIGKEKCPIVDTWWQTETGGILISPLPGITPTKPGSATLPFFGIEPAILREDGTPSDVNEGGSLVIQKPWPGIMRTVFNHHERFKETYFSKFPGVYTTGDGARKDEDGYLWILGRVDDVLNVSGHRIGTAEVESALVSHASVAEAAVVGFPHDIKGQGVYAFVTLKAGINDDVTLQKVLVDHVRKEIGPVATPDRIQFADALPKTRSGKIMRRILRKIAEGHPEDVGDVSTLADPSVMKSLLEKSQIRK
jgi:acetyl-CoA synthetase